MIRRFLAILVFCVLAGCAPVSFGPGSRANPIPTSITTVAKVKAGEVFVKAVGPAGLLSDGIFTQPGLEFTSFNEIQLGAAKRIAVNWVEQINMRAPQGWEFDIVYQEGVSTITQVTPTATGVSYRRTFTLELVVRVKIPAGTQPGVYPALMTIAEVGRRQNTGPVYFNIEVQKPE
jgi:hypothetical protein